LIDKKLCGTGVIHSMARVKRKQYPFIPAPGEKRPAVFTQKYSHDD
jgi:hypothetical protein